MTAAYGGSMKATQHDRPAGVAAPAGGRSDEGRRTPHPPLRLVQHDADEELREIVRALRDAYRAQIQATGGSRALLFIRDALRPEWRPQARLPELLVIFGRAGVSRAELRQTIGAWLEGQIVAAAPEAAPLTAAEMEDALSKEGHEALRALHLHMAEPRSESRLRTLLREVREFIAVGGYVLDRGAETLCGRREGW